jgi:NAD(P)-dependent dehydrogenase (short-subunit alcohol dehydrogenase family)
MYLDERLNLAGKVGVIIGGAGGLGLPCALDLARSGVHLVIVDRDEERMRECLRALADTGVRVIGKLCDARDEDNLREVFALVDAEFGHLDVLVNVIGGTFHQPFKESTKRGWDALIRTNFLWLLHATSLAIPLLEKGPPGGSIINVTSIEAHRAAPGCAVYAGMKAAVANFSRTLAVELAADGIRVNTVAPDRTPTEHLPSRSGTRAGELSVRIGIPMEREGAGQDFSGCVLFLASDLSRYVTGTSLHPDGGTFASAGWWNWPDAGFETLPPAAVLSGYLDVREPANGDA